MDELEKQLIYLKAQVEAYKELVTKALDLATEANIRLEAMEKSTHRIQYVDPNQISNQAPTPPGGDPLGQEDLLNQIVEDAWQLNGEVAEEEKEDA